MPNRSIHLVAVFSMLGALSTPASAASPYIYRYKAGLLTAVENGSTSPTTPGTGNTPGGEVTTPDATPVACGVDNGTDFGCSTSENDTDPSDTDAPAITMTLTGDPNPGDDVPVQCIHVDGGYGNYVIMMSPNGDTKWVKSLDIYERGAAPAVKDGVEWTQYPGYEDPYDLITSSKDFCVRAIPKTSTTTAPGSMKIDFTVADYAPDAVAGDRANYFENSYDQQQTIHFTLKPADFDVDYTPFGMSFDTQRVYQPIAAMGHYDADFLVTYTQNYRDGNIYVACFKYTGGWEAGDSMYYFTVSPIGDNLPGWVEWYDLKPRDKLDSPYTGGIPGLSLQPYQQWPNGASWGTAVGDRPQGLTDNPEICIRIKEHAGSTSTMTFPFEMSLIQYFESQPGYWNRNNVFFDENATPTHEFDNDTYDDSSGGGAF